MWKKNQYSKQNHNNTFNTLENTLYQNYILLYCKRHKQMISNHSNINAETESNTIKQRTTTLWKAQNSYWDRAIKCSKYS